MLKKFWAHFIQPKIQAIFSTPEKCKLQSIPPKLHTGNKKVIKEFFIGEELYWRVKNNANLENPYAQASLYDISINRQGPPSNPISEPDDVLFNVEQEGRHQTSITILQIVQLNKGTFEKDFTEVDDENNNITVIMRLVHDPVCCMYPHSAFKFYLEGKEVTKENYSMTFDLSKGPRKKALKKLRQRCRFELADMQNKQIVRTIQIPVKPKAA